MLKGRYGPWQTSLEQVIRAVESSYGKQFTEDRFKQILAVVPDFYLHKWEFRQGRPQLLVDIPQNIHQILVALRTGEYEVLEKLRQENKASDNEHQGYVSNEIVEKRRKFFKQELIAYVFKHYREEKRAM